MTLVYASLATVRVIHGLGCVRLGWVEIFQFLVGWIGSTIAEVLKKIERIMLMHLKHG